MILLPKNGNKMDKTLRQNPKAIVFEQDIAGFLVTSALAIKRKQSVAPFWKFLNINAGCVHSTLYSMTANYRLIINWIIYFQLTIRMIYTVYCDFVSMN